MSFSGGCCSNNAPVMPTARKLKPTPRENKVQAIFQKAFGKRAAWLCFMDHSSSASRAVEKAFRRRLGDERAGELSFHFQDWREEAAFVVAVHLFPDKFTAREIRDGVESLASHAPYHVGGVAESLGYDAKPPSAYETTEAGDAAP